MASEGKYADLAKRESPDGMLVITPAGKVLHWDAAAEALFGYEIAEATGQSVFELTIPPDRFQEEQEQIARTLAEGRATFESLRRRKDGSRLYVCVTNKLIADPGNDEPLILSSKMDITTLRVRRDAQLVDSHFRHLLENVADAVVIVNPAGHIVYTNANVLRQFGYSGEELLGRPVEVLIPPRYHTGHVGHRVGYFSQPHPRPMGIGLELFGLRKDSSEFPVEVGLGPLQIEGTRLAMSVIRDISERKRVEHELRDKNLGLEAADRAKNQFLASMSHELRTPLNSIIGFTGTLLMKLPGPLSEEQETQLRTVQKSARHLLSLINDLLDLARIESQRLELAVEPLDCAVVLQEVADSLRPQADAKHLEFTITKPAGPVIAQADRRALSQILINLIDNAIKFTDAGFVRVELNAASGRRGSVEFRVTDSGPGISAEDLPQVFNPFTRFKTGTRPAKSGAGLGLHLSQKLAVLMDGSIECRSAPGRGTTFVLTFQGRSDGRTHPGH